MTLDIASPIWTMPFVIVGAMTARRDDKAWPAGGMRDDVYPRDDAARAAECRSATRVGEDADRCRAGARSRPPLARSPPRRSAPRCRSGTRDSRLKAAPECPDIKPRKPSHDRRGQNPNRNA